MLPGRSLGQALTMTVAKILSHVPVTHLILPIAEQVPLLTSLYK